MTEKKGPFDAAIRILKTTQIDVGEANEVRDAFRVLEAVGRVDRGMLCAIRHDFGGFIKSAQPVDRKQLADFFDILLEGLPKKEGKMSTDNIEKMVDDLVCHWYEDKFNNPYRDAIIARLRAVDKWKPLIEAAGKMDKHTVLACFDCAWEYCFAPFACDIDNTGGACQGSKVSIRALLESLPEPEEEEK